MVKESKSDRNTAVYVWFLGICLSFSFSSVQAQNADAAINVGETELTPVVRIGYRSVDNIFRTTDDEIDANSLVVNPRVRWVADKRRLTLESVYEGNFIDSSESARDAADHNLRFAARSDIAIRHRIGIFTDLGLVNQELGSGLSRGRSLDLDEPIRYRTSRIGFNYEFGARNATGNIRLGLDRRTRSYLNQEEFTDGFDFTILTPFINFSYRLSSDTRAFIELRQADVDSGSSGTDRSETSVLVGASFDASRKLGGSIAIGSTKTELDIGASDNESTLAVEVDLAYDPSPFTSFVLTLNRRFDSDSGGANATSDPISVRDDAEIRWRRDWSSRVASTAFFGYSAIERTCPETGNARSTVGLELSYLFRRWLRFGADVEQISNTADVCPGDSASGVLQDDDYDLNSIGIFTRISL